MNTPKILGRNFLRKNCIKKREISIIFNETLIKISISIKNFFLISKYKIFVVYEKFLPNEIFSKKILPESTQFYLQFFSNSTKKSYT